MLRIFKFSCELPEAIKVDKAGNMIIYKLDDYILGNFLKICILIKIFWKVKGGYEI